MGETPSRESSRTKLATSSWRIHFAALRFTSENGLGTHSIGNNARSLRGHNNSQRHLLLRPQHSQPAVGIATLRSAVSDCSTWLHVLLQFLVQEHLNVNTGYGYSFPLCI